jgi:hypothetical protein
MVANEDLDLTNINYDSNERYQGHTMWFENNEMTDELSPEDIKENQDQLERAFDSANISILPKQFNPYQNPCE